MKELKCPKCGSIFQVDEAEYASIVSQIKNTEFEAEIARRMAEIEARHKTEQELANTRNRNDFQKEINKKDAEISSKETEIKLLQSKLEKIEIEKMNEMSSRLAEKDKTIAQLNSAIAQNDNMLKIAVMEERSKAQTLMQEKDNEITKLRSTAELEKREAKINEAAIRKQHEEQLRIIQEQVNYYKDLKSKMSTKMVGETLEQHCYIEFEQYIRPMMPNAYFEKDNDASCGSKGDFIFRDSEDGTEYISIMFEMKNEQDTTSTKHKNDDFLKKLDDDRKKKGCEFAVLVSLLEAENDLYNTGIVNKSHIYPKMYVIRPQFFVPFINLLVQASKKSLEYKKQLILAQSKEVDVTNFETKIEEFKNKFGKHYELASKKFEEAIKQIDDTINKLTKVKESLIGSGNNLRLAQQDTENLTIKKLTYKNPTMKAKFEEARRARGEETGVVEE